jgi:hypothetical protein
MDLKEKGVGGCGQDSSCSIYRSVAGSCEHGNETLGSVKCGEFHQLNGYLLPPLSGQ